MADEADESLFRSVTAPVSTYDFQRLLDNRSSFEDKTVLMTVLYKRLNLLLYELSLRANELRKDDINLQIQTDKKTKIAQYINTILPEGITIEMTNPEQGNFSLEQEDTTIKSIAELLYSLTFIPKCFSLEDEKAANGTHTYRSRRTGTDGQVANIHYSVRVHINGIITRIFEEILKLVNSSEGNLDLNKTINDAINIHLQRSQEQDEEEDEKEDYAFLVSVQNRRGTTEQVEICIHHSSKQILFNILMVTIQKSLLFSSSNNAETASSQPQPSLELSLKEKLSHAHALSVTAIKNMMANPGYTVLASADLLNEFFMNITNFVKRFKLQGIVAYPMSQDSELVASSITNISFNVLSTIYQGCVQLNKAVGVSFQSIADSPKLKNLITRITRITKSINDHPVPKDISVRIDEMDNLDIINQKIKAINKIINEFDILENNITNIVEKNARKSTLIHKVSLERASSAPSNLQPFSAKKEDDLAKKTEELKHIFEAAKDLINLRIETAVRELPAPREWAAPPAPAAAAAATPPPPPAATAVREVVQSKLKRPLESPPNPTVSKVSKVFKQYNKEHYENENSNSNNENHLFGGKKVKQQTRKQQRKQKQHKKSMKKQQRKTRKSVQKKQQKQKQKTRKSSQKKQSRKN